MPNELEMPHALAGVRLQGNKAIGKKVIADPVAAVEIISSRPSIGKYQASLNVYGHPGPTVCGADIHPGIGRPGFVPVLAWMRDSVEPPAELSGSYVVATNMPGRCREPFADLASH